MYKVIATKEALDGLALFTMEPAVVQPLRGSTSGTACSPHSRWRGNVGLTSCNRFAVASGYRSRHYRTMLVEM